MAEIDRSIVQALRRGEERAYALVIDELHAPVYRFLLRLSRNSGVAEDLTQETFIAFWQGIGSFRGRSRFKTWVFGIAYRQFLRHKDKRIVETVELVESDLSDPSDLSELVEESQERARIRQAVYALPNQYREVVCLVYLDGLTYRECAGVLSIPVGTAKSRMNSAFKLLREELSESEVQDDEMRQTA